MLDGAFTKKLLNNHRIKSSTAVWRSTWSAPSRRWRTVKPMAHRRADGGSYVALVIAV